MKVIMVMYDSLNRRMLPPYGCDWIHAPNFSRLAQHTVAFDNCFAGSLPCMPARRELHTARYNFLHRSWGPLEPFDDSMPEMLKQNGIHSHLITDHYHYFEDGGATYHTRYSTWEFNRGQEGDAWKGVVGGVPKPEGNRNGNWDFANQDFVNRSFMPTAEDQPQSHTFRQGLEFIERNKEQDNWLLQIETFDPHEPFFSHEQYQKLYPHKYSGGFFDWPGYTQVHEDQETVEHIRCEYAALLSMCDDNLGKVLDMMDRYNMWEDTMLIVNTDHGYLLGEHGNWAKCHCPMYNEVANIPLFIWDPRLKVCNKHVSSLVQTIDLPAAILEFFGIPLTKDMQGLPLKDVMLSDKPIRDYAMWGIFGGQINITDGRYLLMRSPNSSNKPLYEYTLMPTRHGGSYRRAFIDSRELKTAQMASPFSFTKELPLMKMEANVDNKQFQYPTELFDIQADPLQEHPIQNEAVTRKLEQMMVRAMHDSDCPEEQFLRMGL